MKKWHVQDHVRGTSRIVAAETAEAARGQPRWLWAGRPGWNACGFHGNGTIV